MTLSRPIDPLAIDARGGASARQILDSAGMIVPTRTVLLLDDSEDVLEMYALGLGFAGYRTLQATTVEVALRRVAMDPPGVIVTDIQICGSAEDGWDFIREIRKSRSRQEIPIVVLTGYPHSTIAEVAKELRCAVVSKPCLPDTLVEVLQQVWPQ